MGLVGTVHVAYIFITYRARTLTHGRLWSSDVVVFALPTLLAVVGYVGLFHTRRISWPIAVIVGIVLAFFSLWIGLLIAFNTYGT